VENKGLFGNDILLVEDDAGTRTICRKLVCFMRAG
jgi:hypothetical protein